MGYINDISTETYASEVLTFTCTQPGTYRFTIQGDYDVNSFYAYDSFNIGNDFISRTISETEPEDPFSVIMLKPENNIFYHLDDNIDFNAEVLGNDPNDCNCRWYIKKESQCGGDIYCEDKYSEDIFYFDALDLTPLSSAFIEIYFNDWDLAYEGSCNQEGSKSFNQILYPYANPTDPDYGLYNIQTIAINNLTDQYALSETKEIYLVSSDNDWIVSYDPKNSQQTNENAKLTLTYIGDSEYGYLRTRVSDIFSETTISSAYCEDGSPAINYSPIGIRTDFYYLCSDNKLDFNISSSVEIEDNEFIVNYINEDPINIEDESFNIYYSFSNYAPLSFDVSYEVTPDVFFESASGYGLSVNQNSELNLFADISGGSGTYDLNIAITDPNNVECVINNSISEAGIIHENILLDYDLSEVGNYFIIVNIRDTLTDNTDFVFYSVDSLNPSINISTNPINATIGLSNNIYLEHEFNNFNNLENIINYSCSWKDSSDQELSTDCNPIIDFYEIGLKNLNVTTTFENGVEIISENVEINVEPYFRKQYRGKIKDILTDESNNTYLFLDSLNSSADRYVGVIKYNANFEVLGAQSIFTDNVYYDDLDYDIIKVISTPQDNGFLILAERFEPTYEGTYLISTKLLKINSNLELDWDLTFDDVYNTDVVINSNDKIFLTYSNYTDLTITTKKIANSNGTIEDTIDTTVNVPDDVVCDADGDTYCTYLHHGGVKMQYKEDGSFLVFIPFVSRRLDPSLDSYELGIRVFSMNGNTGYITDPSLSNYYLFDGYVVDPINYNLSASIYIRNILEDLDSNLFLSIHYDYSYSEYSGVIERNIIFTVDPNESMSNTVFKNSSLDLLEIDGTSELSTSLYFRNIYESNNFLTYQSEWFENDSVQEYILSGNYLNSNLDFEVSDFENGSISDLIKYNSEYLISISEDYSENHLIKTDSSGQNYGGYNIYFDVLYESN